MHLQLAVVDIRMYVARVKNITLLHAKFRNYTNVRTYIHVYVLMCSAQINSLTTDKFQPKLSNVRTKDMPLSDHIF